VIGRILGATGSIMAAAVFGNDRRTASFGRRPILMPTEMTKLSASVRAKFDFKFPQRFLISSFPIGFEISCIDCLNSQSLMALRSREIVRKDREEFGADNLEFDSSEHLLIDFAGDAITNLDETRHCELVDSQVEKVGVPVDFHEARISSLVVISRETLDTELSESGLTPD
jgi:hypothetical protein